MSFIIVLMFNLYSSALKNMPKFRSKKFYKSTLSFPTVCENIL
jgi:hypothetical protein